MAFVLEHLHTADAVLAAPPALRTGAAALISVGLTSTYVLTLYLSTSTRIGSKSAFYTTTVKETVRVRRQRRESGDDAGDDGDDLEEVEEVQTREVQVPLDKNHPRVVAARLRVASQSTAAALAVTVGLISRYGHPRLIKSAILRIPVVSLFLGLPAPLPTLLTSSTLPLQPSLSTLFLRHYLPAACIPLGLTMSLFLGPLYQIWLDEEFLPGQARWSWKECVAAKFDNIWSVRNYIAGPITEEILFRACVLNLHHASGSTKAALVFATPLYFGVAHLHHAWETYVKGSRTRKALIGGILQSTFQFVYTSLFGWYANFIFLRTNSILAPILCHSFCNMLGFPNPAAAIEEHPKRKVPIIAAYLAGIATFSHFLWKATEPALYGGSVFW